MTESPSEPIDAERRVGTRRHGPAGSSLLSGALHRGAARFHDLRTAVGLLLLAGTALAVLGTAAFAWVAARVRSGRTQAFDDGVLRWLGAHRTPLLSDAALEVTFWGTATVVILLAVVVALFLWLTRQRWASALLLYASLGTTLLDGILKAYFDRPRPQIFAWGTQAHLTSFPSGHAMSAATVYTTLAYLAARLERHRGARVATWIVAALIVVLVSLSRLFLGVHYPTDVAAGIVVGLAWAGFCMATLEAAQMVARRRRARRGGDLPPDALPAERPEAQGPDAQRPSSRS